MIEAMSIINEIKEKTNGLSSSMFLAIFCMLFEEYCLANHENMVEFFGQMYGIVKQVNEEEGVYMG